MSQLIANVTFGLQDLVVVMAVVVVVMVVVVEDHMEVDHMEEEVVIGKV